MNGIKFAERIKELRLYKNMSMEELGEKLGKTKSTISTWENGKRSPKMNELENIADFFGVSIPYLLGIETDDEEIKRIQTLEEKGQHFELYKYIEELEYDEKELSRLEELAISENAQDTEAYQGLLKMIKENKKRLEEAREALSYVQHGIKSANSRYKKLERLKRENLVEIEPGDFLTKTYYSLPEKEQKKLFEYALDLIKLHILSKSSEENE